MALKEVKNLQNTILIIPKADGSPGIRFEPKESKKVEFTEDIKKAEDMGYVRIGFKNPMADKKAEGNKEVK